MNLNADLQRALMASCSSGLEANWTLPKVTTPLTDEEKNHLYNHPIASYVMPITPQEDIIKKFAIQLFASVATQTFCTRVENAEQEVAQLSEKLEATRLELIESDSLEQVQQTLVEEQVDVSDNNDPVKKGTDPSLAVAKKSISSKATKILQKAVVQEIENLTKHDAVLSRLAKSALKGAGMGAALATFANKVAENGAGNALFDLASGMATSYVTKKVAEGIVRIVACSNPATCTAMFSTMIGELFTGTEMGPRGTGEAPPLPLPFTFPPTSNLPNLYPAEAAFSQGH